MNPPDHFEVEFNALTGNSPFPWQRALFNEMLAARFPSCDIPTGLGKTSAIALWLLALAHHAQTRTLVGYPRRLIYVVNRRTVVDQATSEAERMRAELCSRPELRATTDALRSLAIDPRGAPCAISTLRGQFADNADWRSDPARPAIVVGTIDMIGSRLLFSGYGCGFKSRPTHAGLLGQDALLVHDEAHLEPAFQDLVDAIGEEQRRRREHRPFYVMALTATSRDGRPLFSLGEADREHAVVQRRVRAKKGLALHSADGDRKIADELARLALDHRDGGQAILVFARKLESVHRVHEKLVKAGFQPQLLTGTRRGFEREAATSNDPVFARFLRRPPKGVTPAAGTVYLVCTSAGEVGVDLSADHLVCDLTPFDSMAQRLGRVNRFGEGDAQVEVVHASPPKESGDFEQACARTLALLQKLPERADRRRDASPAALSELPADERREAFTPRPRRLTVGDVLFDAWALTSIYEPMPGRPPVADWLHGVAPEWEPPQTAVAWREEVERIRGSLLNDYPPVELLADHPLKPPELLRDRWDRVRDQLSVLAERCGDAPVWVVAGDGSVRVETMRELDKLASRDDQRNPLRDATVILPPSVGGLTAGLLDGAAAVVEGAPSLDVSDQLLDEDGNPRRARIWDEDPAPHGMRRVRTIDLELDDEDRANEPDAKRLWHWYVQPRAADDDGSCSANEQQLLEHHLKATEEFARQLAARLELPASETAALAWAARRHDLGKDRRVWQRFIRNDEYPKKIFAKSNGAVRARELSRYRHELGSLIDIVKSSELAALPAEAQELALHLVAAHHGRARPHFSVEESLDHERPEEVAVRVVREVPRRFARLQRRYGRWGLAWLEAILHAADVLASQPSDAGSRS